MRAAISILLIIGAYFALSRIDNLYEASAAGTVAFLFIFSIIIAAPLLKSGQLISFFFKPLNVLLSLTIASSLYAFFALTLPLSEHSAQEVSEWKQNLSWDSLFSENPSDNPSHYITSGNWTSDGVNPHEIGSDGTISTSNKPEVFFQPTDKETGIQLAKSIPYLRTTSFSYYENAKWHHSLSKNEKLLADDNNQITINAQKKSLIQGTLFQSGSQRAAAHFPGTRSILTPELTRLSETHFQLPPLEEVTDGYQYQITADPTFFPYPKTPKLLQAGKNNDLHYLRLPHGELRNDLYHIASQFEGDLFDKLADLKNYLHLHCRYTLSPPPTQQDPIRDFLFINRQGYCEHFASSTALLARTLGIPSRVSYGWAGGEYFEAQNLFVFRAKDAHAWCELYLDELGWVIFDTTPETSDALPETKRAEAQETPPSLQELQEPTFSASEKIQISTRKIPWKLILIPLLFAFLIFAFQAFRSSRSQKSPQKPLIHAAYIRAFHHASKRHGLRFKKGITLRDLVALLKEKSLCPSFADELLEYHYSVIYRNVAPSRSKELSFLKQITAWTPPSKAGSP